MIDIGKYSLSVSPFHLYKRATLRKLLMIFQDRGEAKSIKEVNSLIANSSFTEEMKDKYRAITYLRETTDSDWAEFVLEDNKIAV